MSIPIPITGLAANDPVPGQFIEVNFAQGPASSGTATYGALFLGNKTTAGSATVDTVVYGGPASPVALQSEADAIALFGAGSELHRMIRRFLKVNQVTPIYAVAVTESAGANATGTITITGPATANANAHVVVGDEFVDAAITSGDSATVIATAIVAAVNSQTHWPCSASNVAGVVTLTAKQKGPRGNWIRYACAISPGSAGVGSSVTANTFFTGGTTADSSTAALATIASNRYYYNISAAEDATQLGALVAQTDSKAQPLTGLRERVVAGSVDSSGNVTTIATGRNSARCEIVWLQNADQTPAELAAYAAGVYALGEAQTPMLCNFNSYGNTPASSTVWKLAAPRGVTGPSRNTIKAALNNGITPIAVTPQGTTYLVKRITTRSLSNGQPDYRIRDAHKVTVCDRYADDLQAKFALQFADKKIADDPLPGTRALGADVATPRVVKAAVNQLTREYGDAWLLENPETTIANTIVQRETSPTSRMSARIPLDVIDLLDQTAAALDQVG